MEGQREKQGRLVPPKILEEKTAQGINDQVERGDFSRKSAPRIKPEQETKQAQIKKCLIKLGGVNRLGKGGKPNRPWEIAGLTITAAV
jgi:hypothetical protein